MMMPEHLVRRAHSFPWAFTNLRLQTGLKGQFIYDTDLAGFAMWEAGGDSNDILLDAIRSGMNRGMTFC